jgi:hypothetical protein
VYLTYRLLPNVFFFPSSSDVHSLNMNRKWESNSLRGFLTKEITRGVACKDQYSFFFRNDEYLTWWI